MGEEIIIVSGLPRSGTSMMMQMLDAGGLDIMTDNLREPDTDNPRGYYEFEGVKKIAEDSTWLESCRGRAVKMVSPLLRELPSNYRYKVIFMLRDIREILISQHKMMSRLNSEGAELSDEKMIDLYQRHLEDTQDWLAKSGFTEVTYENYANVIADPTGVATRVAGFLNLGMPIDEMSAVVDSTLYRSKPKNQTGTEE